MRMMFRAGIAVILCVAAAGVVVVVLLDPKSSAPIERTIRWGSKHMPSFSPAPARTKRSNDRAPNESFPLFSSSGFENAGYPTAARYTGAIADRGSLPQVKAAIKGRAQRGIDELNKTLDSIPADSPDRPFLTFQIHATTALLLAYEGKFDDAAARTQLALEASAKIDVPPGLRANLTATPGGDPPAARRDRKLRRMHRAFELHLSDCRHGRAPAAVGIARGDQPFPGLPRPAARRSRRALAVEYCLHDLG